MKTSAKSTRPNGSTHRANPSLRCHEEIMSKCSSYGASNSELICCTDNASEQLKSNKLTKKERTPKKYRPTKKPVNVKFQDMSETSSAPVANGALREAFPKGVRSKSVPLIKNQNFEDSVDFFPIKLTTDNDYKLSTQNSTKPKVDVNYQVKSKLSCSSRPTWDKLLRGESEELYQSNQRIDKNKMLKHQRTINNHQIDENLLNKPNTCSQSSHASNSNHTNGITDCSHKLLNSPQSEKIHSNELYVSDPASTLDFLIKQLRDRLVNQPENEHLQTIILDMENALLKISDENPDYLHKNSGKSLYNSFPQLSSNDALKSCESKGTCRKSDSNETNVVTQLKTKLEESCMYLQSLCMQREYCRNKALEKEQLTIQLAESRRLLAIAKSKEKDYEIKIGEFRLKIQEADSKIIKQNESIQALNDSVSKLKAEIEILKSFKESAKRLYVRLKEIANEKEILQSKLSLKDLEVEKLKFLLGAKENLPPETVPKKELEYSQFTEPDLNLDITEENKDISSLSTATSLTQQNMIIACSSQASSSPRRSPSPYNSWQHISSICQQAAVASELNKGIGSIFKNLQSKTEQIHPPQLELELLSSSNSFWSDNEDQDGKSKITITDIDSET